MLSALLAIAVVLFVLWLAFWLFFVAVGNVLGGIGEIWRKVSPKHREERRKHEEYLQWRRDNPEAAADQDFHDEWDQRAWDAENGY